MAIVLPKTNTRNIEKHDKLQQTGGERPRAVPLYPLGSE